MAYLRRKCNTLGDILIGDMLCVGPTQVRAEVFQFFKEHFKKVECCRPRIVDLPLYQILKEEKGMLEEHFSVEEVWSALCVCDGNKELGPDGLKINFIRTNYEIVKNDFMNFLGEFYRDSSVVKHLNNTFLALIPKIRNPNSLKDYRPISLVRVTYKILAKVLANRLKKVMDLVISPNPMAFVKGRQIVDSFVIAEEVIHSWRKDDLEVILVKLDFQKAYDSVDHSFFIEVLRLIGFGSKWIEWMRGCISSAWLSVLVNDSPMKEFLMKKGLR
ncbi:hypothetical protein Ddye_016145 [Dipteronia dyeriana]|uniref:Reverse transcriptase domain-containing protein n=1 Tax=Dipteronia dyeriana TaxID=168575 RepID=A0AAD9U668_9ROSI|nr:hypothetical protein Ddye_016145 [Dipteronia dyeriana]